MLNRSEKLIVLLMCTLIMIPACVATKQVSEQSAQLVIIKVRVVADKGCVNAHGGQFPERDDWKKAVRERVKVLSQYYEKEFAIKLEILSTETWNHGHNISELLPFYAQIARTLLFKNLISLPLGEADLLIGITGSDIGGIVEFKGKYMLTSTPMRYIKKRGGHGFRGSYDYLNTTKYLDRHELGHIFGLDDKDYGPGSLMKPDSRKTEFNELEKKIIMENKIERFGIASPPGLFVRQPDCILAGTDKQKDMGTTNTILFDK